MRGRWPAGREYVDKLDGSADTKERLKAILDTMYGEARLLEACAQLDIGETRFHQLRETALQAALAALEPRPPGRPSPLASPEAEQIRVLQERIEDLELALHVAQVREEIALVFPHLRRSALGPGGTAVADEKKMRPPRVKIKKSR